MSHRERLVDASPWRQAALIREALREIGVVALAPICFPEIRLKHFLFGPRALPFSGKALADALDVPQTRCSCRRSGGLSSCRSPCPSGSPEFSRSRSRTVPNA